MLPIFSNTLKLLKDSFPELVTVIHVAPNKLVDDYIARAIRRWPVPAILIPGGTPQLKYDAFNVSPSTAHFTCQSLIVIQRDIRRS